MLDDGVLSGCGSALISAAALWAWLSSAFFSTAIPISLLVLLLLLADWSNNTLEAMDEFDTSIADTS